MSILGVSLWREGLLMLIWRSFCIVVACFSTVSFMNLSISPYESERERETAWLNKHMH